MPTLQVDKDFIDKLGRAVRGVMDDELGNASRKTGMLFKGIDQRLGEVKALAVGSQRGIDALRKGAQPGSPGLDPNGLVKLLVAAVRAKAARQSVDQFLDSNPDLTATHFKGLVAGGQPMIFKAVTNPAISTVSGWTAELAMGRTVAPLAALAPQSAYGQLQGRSSVLPLSFENIAQIVLPSRTPGDLAGSFHSEAAPLQVRRSTLSANAILPHTIGVISTYTREMSRNPNFESMVRNEISFDTSVVLDTAFLSEDAGTAIAPAGILNAATAVQPSVSTSKIEACAEDLGNLTIAVPNASDLVFISQADVRARAMIYAGSGIASLPWLVSTAAPPKSVIALDAASLAMVESGFSFDTVEDAAIHEESETPLPISTGDSGAGAITAAPVRSLWQTDCLGIRLFSFASWAMRGPGRVAIVENIIW